MLNQKKHEYACAISYVQRALTHKKDFSSVIRKNAFILSGSSRADSDLLYQTDDLTKHSYLTHLKCWSFFFFWEIAKVQEPQASTQCSGGCTCAGLRANMRCFVCCGLRGVSVSHEYIL